MLEAKAKDTGVSNFKKKNKGFQFFFSGDLQFVGAPRIFDWGRPKPQITWNDVIKIFPKGKFLWDKDIVGWKIWNRCCLFARNQDFAKGRGLKLIVEKCKYLTLGTCWESLCNSNVSQTGIWGLGPQPPEALGAWGRSPPNPWASFCNFLKKKSYFNAIGSHFASVQSHLKALDFWHLKANWKNRIV